MTGRRDGGDSNDSKAVQLPFDDPQNTLVQGDGELPYYWSWYRTIFGERRHFGDPRTGAADDAAGRD